MKARNISFDYAKGIGIIIVVFAHLWRGLQGAGLLPDVDKDVFLSISSSCTVWSMPAFFCVSGVLYGRGLEKRHGAKELAGKFDGIFYPYLIWSLITGILEVAGSGYRNGTSSLSSLLNIAWEPRGIFWFLYALLEAFVITEILIKLVGVSKTRIIILPVAGVLLLTWAPKSLPFSLSELQMSFVYFAVGVAVSTKIQMEQRTSVVTAVATLMAILGVLYISSMVFDIRSSSFRSVSTNATPIALVTLILFMIFCYSLPSNNLSWLQRLGERSMDIYLLHLLIIAPVRILMQKALGMTDPLLFIAIGLPAGVIGSLLLSDLLRKIRMGWLFSPPEFLSLKAKLK